MPLCVIVISQCGTIIINKKNMSREINASAILFRPLWYVGNLWELMNNSLLSTIAEFRIFLSDEDLRRFFYMENSKLGRKTLIFRYC
jgi:hypothetical protein